MISNSVYLSAAFVNLWTSSDIIEFFMISSQHKNGNIANFVLAMPFKIKRTKKDCNLER